MGSAIVIALVNFAESYSVSKVISAKTKQKLNVNQEFIGQGMANFLGSFFQSYPAGGSFSRTAVNYAAGAKTGMSNVIASITVVLVLLFLTPLFTYIPRAGLAALVISAVLILLHPGQVFALWKVNRSDGIVATMVFILALLTKPDYALLIGVMAALMFYLWKTMHPRIVRVAKDPELDVFRNADRYGNPSCPQILQLRSEGPIYFANAEYTANLILKRLEEQATPVKFLLIDFQGMGFIDITGVDELKVLHDELRERKVQLVLAGIPAPVMEVLKKSGFMKELGFSNVYYSKRIALSEMFQRLDHGYCKDLCPYSLFKECPTVK
jgi:SulP family sulfate permease